MIILVVGQMNSEMGDFAEVDEKSSLLIYTYFFPILSCLYCTYKTENHLAQTDANHPVLNERFNEMHVYRFIFKQEVITWT